MKAKTGITNSCSGIANRGNEKRIRRPGKGCVVTGRLPWSPGVPISGKSMGR